MWRERGDTSGTTSPSGVCSSSLLTKMILKHWSILKVNCVWCVVCDTSYHVMPLFLSPRLCLCLSEYTFMHIFLHITHNALSSHSWPRNTLLHPWFPPIQFLFNFYFKAISWVRSMHGTWHWARSGRHNALWKCCPTGKTWAKDWVRRLIIMIVLIVLIDFLLWEAGFLIFCSLLCFLYVLRCY